MRAALCCLALLAGPAMAQEWDGVRRLEDERAIARVLVEYGRATDEGDFDAYVGLFAPDGAWIGGMGAFYGRDEIRAMLEANLRPGPRERLTGFHLMSNPVIDLAPDGMTAESVSRWTFYMAGPDGAPRAVMAGRYLDDWVKADGRWLIIRREAPADIPFDDLSGLSPD